MQPGTRLGPYEILAPIGAGGMGEVWRARDERLQRDVAVKILLDHAAAPSTQALARFEREARAIAALSHPNILSIHDFGSDGGVAYAVMELLEGSSLRNRLHQSDSGRGARSTGRCRSHKASLPHMSAGSFIAISSRRTSSSRATAS